MGESWLPYTEAEGELCTCSGSFSLVAGARDVLDDDSRSRNIIGNHNVILQQQQASSQRCT